MKLFKTFLVCLLRVLAHGGCAGEPCCRFSPTCGDYCQQAIERWGFMRGSVITFWRILRCHPFGGVGYDPVPATCGESLSEEI